MLKILAKLSQVPLSSRKGLHMDPFNPEIFKFSPYVHFFKDFQYKTFRDFLCFKISQTQSIFELEKCSFTKNYETHNNERKEQVFASNSKFQLKKIR